VGAEVGLGDGPPELEGAAERSGVVGASEAPVEAPHAVKIATKPIGSTDARLFMAALYACRLRRDYGAAG